MWACIVSCAFTFLSLLKAEVRKANLYLLENSIEASIFELICQKNFVNPFRVSCSSLLGGRLLGSPGVCAR